MQLLFKGDMQIKLQQALFKKLCISKMIKLS